MINDINKIRQDFPILAEQVYGKPLVYLDNAATTQKPQIVIDTLRDYYLHENSNIHRGVHRLSQIATDKYEAARETVREFINAKFTDEIIFTAGTTASMNAFAYSFAKAYLKPGDEILISHMEHHSNIVPWQIACKDCGAVLKVIPIDDNGELMLDEFEKLISPRTKIVSLVHVSNSLGTVNPIQHIIAKAHKQNIPVMIDAAQSIQHLPIDVQKLDCDFLVFSGHKIYGPTGIGILYGKKKFLDEMPPYQGGGDMILSVTFEETKFNVLPYKFEAGTANIAGAIGLGEAIKYVKNIGLDFIATAEGELLDYATSLANEIPEIRIIGTAKEKSSVLSLDVKGIHPHDIGSILDRDGVAVRTGHHCTEPIMRRFNIPATTRASFSFYNTKAEVDALFASLQKVIKLFA
ncbi:MAG: cysteine desulfurase [Candidatus Kapabacteria bacterium]|nr:cysteine desulfurase [Candidatus Kapabacteria bacterium]